MGDDAWENLNVALLRFVVHKMIMDLIVGVDGWFWCSNYCCGAVGWIVGEVDLARR